MLRILAVSSLLAGAVALSGCTDDAQINAATGTLAGAAVGNVVTDGSAAGTLAGAAVGSAIGGSAPTQQQCRYRDPRTGEIFVAACPQ